MPIRCWAIHELGKNVLTLRHRGNPDETRETARLSSKQIEIETSQKNANMYVHSMRYTMRYIESASPPSNVGTLGPVDIHDSRLGGDSPDEVRHFDSGAPPAIPKELGP
jgi:hypothetical protein